MSLTEKSKAFKVSIEDIDAKSKAWRDLHGQWKTKVEEKKKALEKIIADAEQELQTLVATRDQELLDAKKALDDARNAHQAVQKEFLDTIPKDGE